VRFLETDLTFKQEIDTSQTGIAACSRERPIRENEALRLVVHREIPEHPEIQREWNELVFQMERRQVFYTWEWARAMQSGYRDSLKPLLLLAYRGDTLAGVTSLACDRSDRNTRFLAAATSDYCDFVSRPSDRSEMINAVLGKLREMNISCATFASIPEDSATFAAMSKASAIHGYHAFQHPAQVCSLVILGSREERQRLRDTLVGKKALRRNLRGMAQSGSLTLTHLQSQKDVTANLPMFVQAHIARFLATQRVSNFTQPERRLFLEQLSRLLSEAGWLRLSRMSAGDRAIAWNYGFQFGDSWFWYQPTFESAMEQYSPGYSLLAKIVAEACDREDLNVVDLGVGAEGYKDRFSNGTRKTVDFHLSCSFRLHAREIIRYQAARGIKSSPRIESAVRGVVKRLPFLF
jgi:CelD/BcsL family acetyltransferase involved in cellulose biosynthesis